MIARPSEPDGALAALSEAALVVVPRHFGQDVCARWVTGVYAARDAKEWTRDFGGEQFCLGRAFYTHYEEDKSPDYFADARASDARVDHFAPGLQQAMRDLVASVTGGRATPRRGWCGPGIHVFPPDGPVARRGGAIHFDTEGLAARHAAERRPAITIVAVLQVTSTEGGLKVWDVRYDGRVHPTDAELAADSAVIAYGTGDVVLIDSYRLHQIQPFSGDRDRVSATVHAAEIDKGLWETWF